MIACSAEEDGIALSAIPCGKMCEKLVPSGFRAELISHCLRTYGHPCFAAEDRMDVDASESGPGPDLWGLDERKVSVRLGLVCGALIKEMSLLA